MTDARPSSPPPDHEAARAEYSGGYSEALLRSFGRRGVAREAAFFTPHLRPGMRLLDVGCGPGAIAVDLAALVAPGEVVGVDLEPGQFAAGRARARERGRANVRFQAGDAYRLPFADATFDAAFAHAVLYHLREPGRALAEIRRVLKPGGVVGLRDADDGGNIGAPSNPELERAWALIDRIFAHHGGQAHFGRRQRAALRELGFVRVVASASYDCYGTPEATRAFAAFWAHFLGDQHAALALSQGWADRAELDRLCAAFRAWGEHPDAFYARARCEAVGWKA
jgi:SAM-dependent methyltransferase